MLPVRSSSFGSLPSLGFTGVIAGSCMAGGHGQHGQLGHGLLGFGMCCRCHLCQSIAGARAAQVSYNITRDERTQYKAHYLVIVTLLVWRCARLFLTRLLLNCVRIDICLRMSIPASNRVVQDYTHSLAS